MDLQKTKWILETENESNNENAATSKVKQITTVNLAVAN